MSTATEKRKVALLKTKLKDIPCLINSIGNEVKYGEFRDDSSQQSGVYIMKDSYKLSVL